MNAHAHGLRRSLLLSHLVVIAASAATFLLVTLLIAPTLHNQLMAALIGSDTHWSSNGDMAAMEQATNLVFRTAMLEVLLYSGGTTVAVAIVVSVLVSSRIANPVRRLLDASRRIAVGHYTERVPVAGGGELGALAAQFNIMAETLEDAEHRRVALIGDVAHELRTPLATIAGYAEGALDGVVAADDATWALVVDEVARLQRLVYDLQELSRAEAHQLPLSPQACAPAELVQRVCARLATQYLEKEVSLISNVAADLPNVLADHDRMIQVLINLLGNALQHTPAGGTVEIGVALQENELLFCVCDSGIGIESGDLEHVFERFYRVDKARARATGGTGIGLTISKALVEAHNGRIWAQSAGRGRGTTFRFTLPLVTS